MKKHRTALRKRQRADPAETDGTTTARRRPAASQTEDIVPESSSTRTRRRRPASTGIVSGLPSGRTLVVATSSRLDDPVLNPPSFTLSSGSSSAAIAGQATAPDIAGLKQPIFVAIVAVAGVIFLVVLVLVSVCCWRRKKARQNFDESYWNSAGVENEKETRNQLKRSSRRLPDGDGVDSVFDISEEGLSKSMSMVEEAQILTRHQQHAGVLAPMQQRYLAPPGSLGQVPSRTAFGSVTPSNLLPVIEYEQPPSTPTTPNSAVPLLSQPIGPGLATPPLRPPRTPDTLNLFQSMRSQTTASPMIQQQQAASNLGFSVSSVGTGPPMYASARGEPNNGQHSTVPSISRSSSGETHIQEGVAFGVARTDESNQIYQNSRQPVQHFQLSSPPRRRAHQSANEPITDKTADVYHSGQQLSGSNLGSSSQQGSNSSLSPLSQVVPRSDSKSVTSPTSKPAKTFGSAPALIRQLTDHTLSVHSEMAEIANFTSPETSPVKKTFAPIIEMTPAQQLQNYEMQRELSAIAEASFDKGAVLPDHLAQPNLTVDEDEYVFNGRPSYVESRAREADVQDNASLPSQLVNPSVLATSTSTTDSEIEREASFQIGKHLMLASPILDSPELQRSAFQPLITPPSPENKPRESNQFLSLAQIAMMQKNPDYRSPTYSIYGVYSDTSYDEASSPRLT